MNLFGKSDVNMLQKRISELEIQVDTSDARIAELEAECSDYKKSIEAFHMSTTKYDKKMEDLKKQYEVKEAELKAKLQETENSVNRRVNQTLQSVGVNNFLVEIPVEVKSPKELFEKFLKMPPGSEKTKFYQEHEAEIRKGMNLKG